MEFFLIFIDNLSSFLPKFCRTLLENFQKLKLTYTFFCQFFRNTVRKNESHILTFLCDVKNATENRYNFESRNWIWDFFGSLIVYCGANDRLENFRLFWRHESGSLTRRCDTHFKNALKNEKRRRKNREKKRLQWHQF